MAKVSKEVNLQIEGMQKALAIVEAKGIEALKDEIAWRGIIPLPLKYSKDKVSETIRRVEENMLDSVLILSLAVLRDEFDFGEKRAKRFIDRYMLKTACLMDYDSTQLCWQDLIDQVKEELGYEIKLHWPDDLVR